MEELFKAILALKTTDEAANFFRDLLTAAELKEFANRWQMVKLLVKGLPYAEIASELKTSTTTVSRVAHWLHTGMGGYQTIAGRLLPKKNRDSLPHRPFRLRGKRTWI